MDLQEVGCGKRTALIRFRIGTGKSGKSSKSGNEPSVSIK
jgi:hypothetical protein